MKRVPPLGWATVCFVILFGLFAPNSKPVFATKPSAITLEMSGDSMVLHHTVLQQYLPQSLSGYQAKVPEGATLNMGAISYSLSSITFVNNQNETIKITIIDYIAAAQIYEVATMAWSFDIDVDTPEEKASSITPSDNMAGWQSFKKKTGEATLVLGIANRFLLTVEAQNQVNTDKLISIVR